MDKKTYCLLKRSGSLLAALVLLLTMAGCAQGERSGPEGESTSPSPVPNTMTGEELMKELRIGWNLGNTFDAPDGETSWGNPLTTKELLEKVKELGFGTIRIPISWGKHVSEAPEYTIDADFLNRVETVVQDALDAGLYVIINSHHDNEIYMPTPGNRERGMEYLQAIWTQVGQRFRDADYRLIFQTMNEPRVVGSAYEWNIDTRNEDCMAAVEVVNELNQAALDAIRATGGKNADRFVIVSPYAANPQAATVSAFRLPEDSAQGKLVVSIHAYTPYNLCLNTRSPDDQFTLTQLTEIKKFLKSVDYRFVQKGIPVVIDEMGCINKDNPDARYAWAKAYISAAAEYGMPCVWWDNGEINGSGENFGLINRRKLEVYEESLSAYQGLMDGLTEE